MPKQSRWRALYAPDIAEIIAQGKAQGLDEAGIRKRLRQEFGSWKGCPSHPYRMWLKEVNTQLQKPKKPKHKETTQIKLF